MREVEVASDRREQLIDITDRVRAAVQASRVREGLCHVFVPHTTCGVTVNEGADPDVRADLLQHLRGAIPENGGWRHAEGNSDAHLKSILIGSELTLPVADGELRLGRWQSVFLCEFDGPRRRAVWITVR